MSFPCRHYFVFELWCIVFPLGLGAAGVGATPVVVIID